MNMGEVVILHVVQVEKKPKAELTPEECERNICWLAERLNIKAEPKKD